MREVSGFDRDILHSLHRNLSMRLDFYREAANFGFSLALRSPATHYAVDFKKQNHRF